MITSSPFLNLVIIFIIFFVIILININIIKKIVLPLLFILIVLYFLGPKSLKNTFNNYSMKIINNPKVNKIYNSQSSKNIKNILKEFKSKITEGDQQK